MTQHDRDADRDFNRHSLRLFVGGAVTLAVVNAGFSALSNPQTVAELNVSFARATDAALTAIFWCLAGLAGVAALIGAGWVGMLYADHCTLRNTRQVPYQIIDHAPIATKPERLVIGAGGRGTTVDPLAVLDMLPRVTKFFEVGVTSREKIAVELRSSGFTVDTNVLHQAHARAKQIWASANRSVTAHGISQTADNTDNQTA